MFCPVCRSEFREGFKHCDECGVELVGTLESGRGLPQRQSENIDELVALDVMEGLDWPMIGEGNPVKPAKLPEEYHSFTLPGTVDKLEKNGVPALLLLEGSSFDGISVFGVTLEAEGVYVPEDVIENLDEILGPVKRKTRTYRLKKDPFA